MAGPRPIQRPMQRIARWHIWLGWLVAIPLLLWTASGLLMVARPIEEVRGEDLRAPPLLLDDGFVPQAPIMLGKIPRLESFKLVRLASGPVWIFTFEGKKIGRASATDGTWLGPVAANEARQLARSAYLGNAALVSVRRFSADQAPLDLRKPRPSWQATFADGAHLYVDADSGEVLALRTRFWRAYDFMWGLHIMDPAAREDTHHPLLIGFAALALVSVIFGTVLLFRRRKAMH